MDANILIFIAVAVALLAILYFAWPRKKAEPPRVEAPAESVTPVVPVDPALQAATALHEDSARGAAETAVTPEARAKAAPKAPPKTRAKPEPEAKAAPKAVGTKAAPKPEGKPASTKAKAASEKAAPVTEPAAVKPKAKAAAKTAPAPTPPAPHIPDDIALLKGVGPKLVALLQSMGVTSLGQIAAWTPADVSEIDAKLGAFAGRIARDNWVDQAKLLSSGDIAAFEKKYGSLGSEIKKG